MHPRLRLAPLALFVLAALAACFARGAESAFPPGAVIVNVTQPPFNADPTGVADSTAAIQLALNRASQDGVAGDGIADDGTDDGWQDGSSRSRPRIIYFPVGVYRLTGSVVGPALDNAQAGGLIVLQGQSRENSILRLDASAAGFGNPASPKPVFTNFTGNSTNNAFMNGVENLTIEVGAGNPGAIALQFGANNTGHVRGVTLRTLDPARAGAVGLHLSPGSSSTNPTGIGLVQDVSIEGFATGIDTTRGLQMPWVLDRVTLAHQTVVGIANAHRPLSINALASTNSVPAVVSTGASGHVVMINSSLSGGASNQPAIDLQAGHGFFRNISRTGYAATVRVGGIDQPQNLAADEFVAGPVLKLWDNTPSRSLALPVADAPAVPWDAAGDWHLVPAPTGVAATDTAALQAAFNSGKPSVLLSPGAYAINATVVIGPAVRRVLGNWATLRVDSAIKNQDVPLLRLAASSRPAVVVEKLQGQWNDATAYLIHHESSADLILRDVFWVAGPVYRNTRGAGGRLFLENIHSLGGGQTPRESRPAFVFDHQQVWARQINPEMQHPHMINDGGQLWILGFKTGEQRGPVVVTRNGGSTEILGGVQNMTHDNAPADAADTTLLEIHNANVSAVLAERFEGVGSTGGLGWGNHAFVARETRGAETRTLRPAVVHRASGNTSYASPVPVRAGQLGSVVPLFVGYQTGATVSTLVPRLREDAAATPAFVVSRDSPFTASPLTLFYTVSGSAAPGTDYTALSGSVTIPAGQSTAEIALAPLDRDTLLPARTVVLTLSASPGYTLGTQVSASLEIIAESLIAPDAIHAVLPADSTESFTVTVFNPEPAPVTYGVTGPSSTYTVAHRALLPGDTVPLPPARTVLFPTKPNDDSLASVALPFPFPFYGQTHTALKVSTNGFVTFNNDTFQSLFSNGPLPSSNSGSFAMIAAYWDDLYLDAASQVAHAAVDLDNNGVTDAWVLEFDQVTTYATRNNAIPERLGFQLWLFPDGSARVAYTASTITAVSYTIGLQNHARSQGLALVHDGSGPSSVPASPLPAPYRAQAGTTVLFQPPVNWVFLSASSLVVPAGGQASFNVLFDSASLSPGEVLSASLSLVSPAVSAALPVSLSVSGAPPAPAAFQAAALSTSTINLSWSDAPNETGYRLESSPDGVNAWSLVATLPADTAGHAHTGLAPETARHYRIRATNTEGDSPWSYASASTPPLPSAPAAASGLVATLVSAQSVRLDWTDRSANESGFRVERSADGGATFSVRAVVAANTASWFDADLPSATTLVYRVVAANAVGDAPASGEAFVTTPSTATVLSPATAAWLRGRTGSSPASSVASSGAALAVFAGGVNSATNTQAPVWAHFPAVTLADGETLRLRATLRVNGSTPSVGQGFSLGLVNTQGTRALADSSGNNPVERRDDGGYGFTFGLGGSTTTRYLHKPSANASNGPWGNIDNAANTLALGATPATTTLPAETSVAFVLDLIRADNALRVEVTLNGALYDGGRLVAAPETFTYDSVALVLRRETLSVTLTDLVVERFVPLTPRQSWRLEHFGFTASTGMAADDADPDADGHVNLLEYAFATDPLAPSSAPAVSIQVSGPGLQVSFLRARPELLYEVLASSTLAPDSWTVIATNPGATSLVSPVTVTDPEPAAPRRFLRLRITP